MTTHTVPVGTPLHCNRNDCGATFPAPTDLERTAFAGTTAARTTTMVTCPSCQRPDSQWVYVEDTQFVLDELMTAQEFVQYMPPDALAATIVHIHENSDTNRASIEAVTNCWSQLVALVGEEEASKMVESQDVSEVAA